MIMAILEFRTRVCELYQKLQLIIDPIFRFLLALIVIRSLNTVIGYDVRLTKPIILIALSLLSAFTPSSVLVLICLGLIVANVYSVSVILAVFMVVIFTVMYCFFLRFTPNFGYVVVAIPILYLFKVPYLIPMMLGLVSTPLTILPTACGVFVYYMISVIQNAATLQTGLNADDVLILFNTVVDNMVSNKEMLFTIAIFAVVTTVVFVVRKLQFDYSFEIAIGIGTVVSIFGFVLMVSILKLDLSIVSIIGFNLLSGVLVLVIHFFQRILDYTAVEHVQFEDDDYYYYVRAVPKISVGVPQMSIKHINERNLFKSSSLDDESEEDIFDTVELDRRLLEKRTREAKTHERLKDNKKIVKVIEKEDQSGSAETSEADELLFDMTEDFKGKKDKK